MNLDAVIQQIRTYVPLFEGRVSGAYDYFRAKDQTWLKTPAAFVVPLGDEVRVEHDETGWHQDFTDRIAVIVILDNQQAVSEQADRRFQSASRQFDPIKWLLFRALINWDPGQTIDVATPDQPEGDKHQSQGLFYIAGDPLEPDKARSFFQFTFGLEVQITDADVWRPGADPLEGIDVYIIDEFVVGEAVGRPLRDVLAAEKIDLHPDPPTEP